MKMFKQLMSIMLAATMCVSLTAPAMAVVLEDNEQNSEMIIADATGNEMNFHVVDNGNGTYLMEYYFNGELDTTYLIGADADYVEATTVDGEEYILETNDYIQPVADVPVQAVAASPVHFCTITYQTNSAFKKESKASVEMTATTKRVQRKFYTQANTKFADGVAMIANNIISVGFALFATSGGTAIEVAATTILTGMIANNGAELVDGIIKNVLSDSFDCVETKYTYQLTLITEKFTKTGTLKDAGIYDSIEYDNGTISPIYDGYTPTTIQKTEKAAFSMEVWKKCAPNYAAPAYKTYLFY